MKSFFSIFVYLYVLLLPVHVLSSSHELVLLEVENRQLSQERQWRKLLHFEKNIFQIRQSQMDSPLFFLSPEGKKNPQAELLATVTAFFSPVSGTDTNEHPQCRFPARYRWLKNQLKDLVLTWPDVECPRFKAFFDGIRGESVSLVFSSYYLNNPSSAFGHTFLRINKAASLKDGKRYELLDYGINYAADTDTNNAFLYDFKGLFGLFPGKFRSIPYYYKVREYNNAESRDLWEYELRLPQSSVDMLIAHIWEIGPLATDYWYLTENCSYHMLSVLEAADPSVQILDKLDQFVIPADTVRILWNETELIKSYNYRPSIRQVYLERWRLLSSQEREELEKLAHQLQTQDEITYSQEFLTNDLRSQARVLDAFIDYVDFRYAQEVQEAGREEQLKLRVLAKRSENPMAPEDIVIVPRMEEQPHLAHPSGRWGLGVLSRLAEKDNPVMISHRFALHDRLDPSLGYPKASQISFFDLELSAGKKLELENFSAFELVSAGAWSRLIPENSWRFKLGIERTRNENFLPTHEGVVRLGSGWTLQKGNFDLSAQLLGEAHYGPHLPHDKFWGGVGPYLEAHLEVNSFWLMQAHIFYRRDSYQGVQDYLRTGIESQWSFSKNLGVRLQYRNERFLEQTSLQLFNYY